MRTTHRIDRIVLRVPIQNLALASLARRLAHSVLARASTTSDVTAQSKIKLVALPIFGPRRGVEISQALYLIVDHFEAGLGFICAAAHIGLGRRDEFDIASSVFGGEEAKQPVLV